MIINYSHNDIAEEAIHLGNNATVFQAEVSLPHAVGPAAHEVRGAIVPIGTIVFAVGRTAPMPHFRRNKKQDCCHQL